MRNVERKFKVVFYFFFLKHQPFLKEKLLSFYADDKPVNDSDSRLLPGVVRLQR